MTVTALQRIAARAQSLFVLLLLFAVLGIASPRFFSGDNFLAIFQQSSLNALLGVGLTFVILSGGIDLSVGSLMALCGVVVADLVVRGVPIPAAVAVGVALGAACGAVNGAITTLTRIPPFIATLGMMLVARSVAKIYSGSAPISGLPDAFRHLSGDVLGVPILGIAVVVFYLAAHLVLNRTKLGRYTYALGGNEQAAWLSGVRTGRTKIAVYAISGVMAGVAGVLLASRNNAGMPLAGDMYELYAIAAAVIGGVSLLGGEGHVVGTLIGALIMGTLRNGLTLLHVPSAWEQLVVGVVLVAAVVVDRSRHQAPGARAAAAQTRRRWLAVGFAGAALAGAVGLRVMREAAPTPSLRIAFVPKTLSSPFWKTMEEGARTAAAREGVELIALAADRESDVEAQHQILENLIGQRVDAILLAPSGSKEILSAVRKANAAGIPVLIVDSDVDRVEATRVGAVTATYIGSDNFEGGRLAGMFLAEQIGGAGKVAIIAGNPGHESTEQRQRGFRKAMEAHPGITIVASQAANADRDLAHTVAQNLLQADPDLAGLFAANDEMALGAVEALDKAGKLARVKVVGFDASPGALQSIEQGRLLASVAQYPSEMGRIGVEKAIEVVRKRIALEPVIHTKVEVIHAKTKHP